MNGTGYIGLPRVNIDGTLLGYPSVNNNNSAVAVLTWDGADNVVSESGLTFKPTVFDDTYIIKGDKYRAKNNTTVGDNPVYRIKNDNTKYTISVR